MDKALLITLGLDPEQDLKSLLEEVEGKQFELLERLETTSQQSRKEELSALLSRVDTAISQIKYQLEEVNSALILDMDEPESEVAVLPVQAEPAEQEQKRDAEAELASKVQALKEKIESREKQESIPVPAADNAPEAAPEEARQNQNPKLQYGLQCYRKKDFAPALHTFKQLAEQNEPEAQYMLACMYKRGEGTAIELGRAEYWMKRAADNGDPAAQFDYAVLLLSKQSKDPADLSAGMDYLNRAAAQGYQDAMERFVELVDKGDGSAKDVVTARDYCEKLLPRLEDSFEIQKYTELAKSLRGRYVKNIVSRYGDMVASITSAVGALILICVIVLLFGNYHQQNLLTYTKLTQIPAWLSNILPDVWHRLPSLTNPIYRSLKILEKLPTIAWLIAAGGLLKSIGHTFKRNALSKLLVRLASLLRYAAFAGHIYLCSRVEAAMQQGTAQATKWLRYYFPVENLLCFAAMIVVGFLAGRILNWIARKGLGLVLKVKL